MTLDNSSGKEKKLLPVYEPLQEELDAQSHLTFVSVSDLPPLERLRVIQYLLRTGAGRSSLAAKTPPFAGSKCLATYHPAFALRVYEQTPLLLFDLKRAHTEGESPDLVLPETQIALAQTTEDPRANTLKHSTRRSVDLV